MVGTLNIINASLDAVDGFDFSGISNAFSGVMHAVGILVTLILLGVLFMLGIGIMLYVFRAVGLMKISERRGLKNSALAWLPFIGIYRAGVIADDISGAKGRKTYYRYIILVGEIAHFFLAIVQGGSYASTTVDGTSSEEITEILTQTAGFGIFTSLVGLGVFIATMMALYAIYAEYSPYNKVPMIITSCIFRFLVPIYLFAIRNKIPYVQLNQHPMYPYYPPNFYAPQPMPNQQFQNMPPQQYMQQPFMSQPPQGFGAPNIPTPPPPPAEPAAIQTETTVTENVQSQNEAVSSENFTNDNPQNGQ